LEEKNAARERDLSYHAVKLELILALELMLECVVNRSGKWSFWWGMRLVQEGGPGIGIEARVSVGAAVGAGVGVSDEYRMELLLSFE
jgi:hypothetical protein